MKPRTKSSDLELDTAALLKLLRNKLRNDPVGWLGNLKELIDEVPETIEERTLFNLLEPHHTETGISDNSVDMLFDPSVRRKLKEWQRSYFDNSLRDFERDNARDKIKKVFERLTFQGSGARNTLSEGQEDELFAERYDVKKTCKEIIKDCSVADGVMNHQRSKIKEKFLWCREVANENDLLQQAASAKRPEGMRKFVLALKYQCSPRIISDTIREKEEGFRDSRRYFKKHPNTQSISIKGSGKNKKILPH